MPRTYLSTSTVAYNAYSGRNSMTSLLIGHIHRHAVQSMAMIDGAHLPTQDGYDAHGHHHGRHLDDFYAYPADAVPVKRQHRVMSIFLLILLCFLVAASVVVFAVRCFRKNDPEWQHQNHLEREEQERKRRMKELEYSSGYGDGDSTSRYINACIEMSNAATGCSTYCNNTTNKGSNDRSNGYDPDDDVVMLEQGGNSGQQQKLLSNKNKLKSPPNNIGSDYVLT